MGKIGLKNISKIDPELTNELIFFCTFATINNKLQKNNEKGNFCPNGISLFSFYFL